MIPSNHTEALARVYAAATISASQIVAAGQIASAIDTNGTIDSDLTVLEAARLSVRDFVTLINTLEDEERERVGSKPA